MVNSSEPVTQDEFKIVGEATLELLNRMAALEARVRELEDKIDG